MTSTEYHVHLVSAQVYKGMAQPVFDNNVCILCDAISLYMKV